MKKSELKDFIKEVEETIAHWNQEDTSDFDKGYTSGYEAIVRELKEKFKL